MHLKFVLHVMITWAGAIRLTVISVAAPATVFGFPPPFSTPAFYLLPHFPLLIFDPPALSAPCVFSPPMYCVDIFKGGKTRAFTME